MGLCVNILYDKFLFILNAFGDIVSFFSELNFYLDILKYPKPFSLFVAVLITVS